MRFRASVAMRYIIRTIPPKGREAESQTYWLPGPRGFTRMGNIDEARARPSSEREWRRAIKKQFGMLDK
jgi:hypothetical protein